MKHFLWAGRALPFAKQLAAYLKHKILLQSDGAVGRALPRAEPLRSPLAVGRRRYNLLGMLFSCSLLLPVCLVNAHASRLGGTAELPAWEQQTRTVKGELRSAADGQPLAGATIAYGRQQSQTDSKGRFAMELGVAAAGELVVSHVGYKTQLVAFDSTASWLAIRLALDDRQIEEVDVMSTGYQNISKERVVGSVAVLGEEQLGRSVSSNILNRMDGLTTAVYLPKFNSSETGPQPQFTIRGKSTLFADAEPLVVLDGFPYAGALNALNPADIASISILKDGAAASIWGARSGNGVIVVTTKSGSKDQSTVSAEVIESISDLPDLWYSQYISTSDYIDNERFLFDKGAFNSRLKTGYQGVSPVVELLDKMSKGELTDEAGNALIDAYRDKDLRHQQLRYLYQRPLEQQYNLAISSPFEGGNFYISGGLNRLDKNTKLAPEGRKTLLMKYDRRFLNDRLNFSLQSNLSSRDVDRPQVRSLQYPYEEIVSAEGERLHLSTDLRKSYIDHTGEGNLLDWHFNPLDDLGKGMATNSALNLRLNGSVDAKLLPFLTGSVKYQYARSNTDELTRYTADSYYIRSMVNGFTKYDKATDTYIRQVPEGEERIISRSNSHSALWRAQLSFDKAFGSHHRLTALAAFELSDTKGSYDSKKLWGYDPSTGTAATLDHMNAMPKWTGGSQILADGNYQSWSVDRYRSYLLNAAYSYRGVYDVYGSLRRDESNLFGVETNQKGVPLWSMGAAYNLKKDVLQAVGWLSELRLRGSYGVQGNVDKSMSAWLTAKYESYKNKYQQRFSTIVNPPNPSLRWEQTQATNLGIDLGLWGQRVVVQFDQYWKKGYDLIGNGPIAPQTGMAQFRGNVANTSVKGFDLSLTSHNLTSSRLQWRSVLNFSKAKAIVTRYLVDRGSNLDYMRSNYTNPYEGYPQSALFSFPYAGLDSEGDPLGYLEGEASKDYVAILASKGAGAIQYHGPRVPPYFGSLRNDFSYGKFYASVSMRYSLGAFFRRESLKNSVVYSATPGWRTVYDYERRWQKAGDEAWTDVPALVYPAVSKRDSFYEYSSVLVEKADYARIQDIQLGCRLTGYGSWLKAVDMTFVLDNVAVLWRANRHGLDPDVFQSGNPAPRQFSLRLKASL